MDTTPTREKFDVLGTGKNLLKFINAVSGEDGVRVWVNEARNDAAPLTGNDSGSVGSRFINGRLRCWPYPTNDSAIVDGYCPVLNDPELGLSRSTLDRIARRERYKFPNLHEQQ